MQSSMDKSHVADIDIGPTFGCFDRLVAALSFH
jgi:hypothetical protein